jgi:hypothetical protein
MSIHNLRLDLEQLDLAGIGGHLPTLFPHKLKPEEHLTSRLMSVLIAVRPFRMRFFEHTKTLGGRRPSTARNRAAQVRAIALLEPSLDPFSRERADAAISIRNGSRAPWRCVIEVKYLTKGRQGPGARRSLDAKQVERTYTSAKRAGFDHVLTISHETAANGLNPSGFAPRSSGTGPTLSHLSWLEIAALLQRTLEDDADDLGPAARAILIDLAGYLRASEIWTYANNVSLSRTDFAVVRSSCRAAPEARRDSMAALQSFHEVVQRWHQFATAAANAMTARTSISLQARMLSPNQMVRRLRATGRLELNLVATRPDLGSISASVDVRERMLETAWVIDVATRIPSERPRITTRWSTVEGLLKDRPAGTTFIEVLDEGGKSIVRRTSVAHLLAAVPWDSELRKQSPTAVRFVRTRALHGREDLTSSNVTPLLNDMLRRTASW